MQTNNLASKMVGKNVLVRTDRAGVHYGTLLETDNSRVVILGNARRIWWWKGAFTLSEITTRGISNNSRLSCKVNEIYLCDVIEIIPITNEAYKILEGINDYQI